MSLFAPGMYRLQNLQAFGMSQPSSNLMLKEAFEASMVMLNYMKETAAAIAEAEALETAVDVNSENHNSKLKSKILFPWKPHNILSNML